MSAKATPVGGKLLTPGFLLLLGLALVGLIAMGYRFAVGLGASTAMNDGFPWGVWIAFDVVTGTAIGAGGYSMALLIYVLNKGQYHPLVRPAMVTTALGYTMAALSIVVDLGRYWNVWRIPIAYDSWNFNSALLEVALCVMAYMIVAWLEVGEAVLEQWSKTSGLAKSGHGVLKKILPFVVALGVLLPTMHQSSLGTIFVLTSKLHPLWHTGFLPLLFLISCLAMGYGGVVLESSLSARAFSRPKETELLSRLAKVMAFIVFGYLALRLGDVTMRGAWATATPRLLTLFAIENLLFLVPAVMLMSESTRKNPGALFATAAMLLAGGALYRFDVYLVAFDPGRTWSYFPSVVEILVSMGLVALEIAAYVFIVKKFPILTGRADEARAAAH